MNHITYSQQVVSSEALVMHKGRESEDLVRDTLDDPVVHRAAVENAWEKQNCK